MFSYQALPFTHISEGCIWEEETNVFELIDKVFIAFFFLYFFVSSKQKKILWCVCGCPVI